MFGSVGSWDILYFPLLGLRVSYSGIIVQSVLRAILVGETRAFRIRVYGVSNETTFGVCEWARAAEKLEMPAPASTSFEKMHHLREVRSVESLGFAPAFGIGFQAALPRKLCEPMSMYIVEGTSMYLI